ncbi:MAG: ActS/PrrB/RegB family redox-sensitive histidine kinase [Pseudomonadota bacterium]
MIEKKVSKPGNRADLRLDTLIRIRWLAIIGQTVAVFLVWFGLGFEFYLELCLILIALSAWLNLFLRLRYRASFRLTGHAALALLSYDILQLSMLLYLTGGLQNPFSILLIVPVVVSATTQGFWQFVPLGALTIVAATLLVFFHLPLPWYPGEEFQLPLVYIAGNWVALVSTLVFTAVYAYRVADEARNLSDALAATELVLQREQHLSLLDGLAAAAAHELGTPLATIALVSKEMQRELTVDSPLREDAMLLRAQAERCREILQKLTSLSGEGEGHIGRMRLSSLMEEVASPHRDFGIAIDLVPGSVPGEPVLNRSPAILYGLGNLIENAVDFAESRVKFSARWNDDSVTIQISDDGKGFSRDLLERAGDPFVTTRKSEQRESGGGLGLGLFIAKTLLQRSGATIEFSNAVNPGEHGAVVSVTWPRQYFENFEEPVGSENTGNMPVALATD